MPLGQLLETVLPVFGFIAIGYLIIAAGLLRSETCDHVSNFVFTVGVPALLIRSVGTLAMPDISPWPFWAVYFSGVGIITGIGVLITERLFKRDARAGVIGGMSASFSNTVMVGVPLVTAVFGPSGQVLMFVLIAVHLPVMMFVSAFLIEIAEYRDGSAAGRLRFGAAIMRVCRSMMRNPMIIAILIGAFIRLTGVPIVGVPLRLVDGFAETAIPLALTALGMSLYRYGVSGNVRPAIVLGIVKLMVMPAVVYVLAVYVAGLSPLATSVLVLAAACPTGVNAYLIANRFQTGLALSANTITLTTAVSMLTFTLWLAVLVD